MVALAVSVKDLRELTTVTSRSHEFRLPGLTGNSILHLNTDLLLKAYLFTHPFLCGLLEFFTLAQHLIT